MHVDPRLDGVAVLGCCGAEDEQVVDLREDILVDRGGSLRGHRDTKALESALLDDPLPGLDERSVLPADLLRQILVALLEEKMGRGAIGAAVEAIAERLEEAAQLGLGELADVEDGGELLVDEEICDERAGCRVEGNVAVPSAEDGDGQARTVALGRRADAVPVALGIDHDDGHAHLVHFFEKYDGRARLAGALLGQDAVGAGDELEGKVDALGDVQTGCHSASSGSGLR